jgi:hypothetical protein
MTTFVNVFDQLANVAQIARGCPTVTLRRAFVRAMRDWCAQTQWLRITASGVTEAGEVLYDLGSDPLLEIIGLYAVSGSNPALAPPNSWPLTMSDPSSWNPLISPGAPLRAAYTPEGQMALNPTPDGAYDMVYNAIVQPKDGVVQIPSQPLKKYSTPIEAGTLAYLLAMKDTPWFNPGEAAKKQREFGAGISNGKAEVQRNYNTGSQRASPRPFGVAWNAFNRPGGY